MLPLTIGEYSAADTDGAGAATTAPAPEGTTAPARSAAIVQVRRTDLGCIS
jgi:hypothetical protein